MNQDFLSTKSDKKIQPIILYVFQEIDLPQVQDNLKTSYVSKLYGVTNGLIDSSLKTTYDSQLRTTLEEGKQFYQKLPINYDKDILCNAIQLPDIKDLIAQTHITEEQIQTYVEQRSDELCEYYEIVQFKDMDLYLILMARRKFMIIKKNNEPIITEITKENVDNFIKMLSLKHGIQDKRRLIYETSLILRNSKTLTNLIQIYLQELDNEQNQDQEKTQTQKIELKHNLKPYTLDAMLTIPTYKKDTVSFDWEKTTLIQQVNSLK